MSSLPSSTNHLSVTPTSSRKIHRHRRSAAISGDFDSMGLGLFSPPPTSKSLNNISINPSNAYSNESSVDKHFQFDNVQDFTNKPVVDGFAFPNKTPDMNKTPSGASPQHFGTLSPGRNSPLHPSSYGLNSPIKLDHRKAASVSNISKTRFFLTEETNLNKENIPDALIDLDEVMNANLHIGYISNSTSNSTPYNHTRTELAPPDIENYDDFLGSPFTKQGPSPFVSSPLSSLLSQSNHLTHSLFNCYNTSTVSNNNHNGLNLSNLLFDQPIQEQTGDSSAEEEDSKGLLNDNVHENVENDGSLEYLPSFNETEDLFANPPSLILGSGIYSNLSASSSTSSLRSTGNRVLSSNFIEKTLSNSSRDSAISNGVPVNTPTLSSINTVGTPSGKRSGAKANRYQIFYDQSNRISNALKVSSSESINIVRSNSSNHNNNGSTKEIRSLGHSSSLPSLKSNPKRNMQIQPRTLVRFGELRTLVPEYRRVPTPPVTSLSQEKVNVLASHSSTKQAESVNIHSGSKIPQTVNSKSSTTLTLNKNASTSPISVHSDASSTVISSNDTIQSTDRSSLASHTDIISTKFKMGKITKTSCLESTSPVLDGNNPNSNRSQNETPSIVISSGYGTPSTPSTNSTFKPGEFSDDQASMCIPHNDIVSIPSNESTISASDPTFTAEYVSPPSMSHQSSYIALRSASTSIKSSSKSSPKKASPRRALSPSEEKILNQTKIPTFRTISPAAGLPNVNEEATTEEKLGKDDPAEEALLSDPLKKRANVNSFSNNFDPFNTFPSKSGIQAETDSPEVISRRGSAFTILLKEVAAIPRRGSSSHSIISQPISFSSASGRGSSAFSRFRHSKSKSMFINDGNSNTSRTPSCFDIDDQVNEKKRKSSKFNWFRKK